MTASSQTQSYNSACWPFAYFSYKPFTQFEEYYVMLFNTSFVWHEFTGLFSTSFCHVLSDSNKQSLKEIQEVQRKEQSKKSNCKLQILVDIILELLVSKELNHFGVIAGLCRQIGGRSSRIVLFCSFWRLFTIKMIKSVKVFPFSFWKIITNFFLFYFKKFKPPE